ncbi:type I restriction endonuclease subunit R [Dialister sp.]|uniref:type I restriction endonuclease subunit R n=1 Tax=Dialister sp. TaxID=1955814 RepID=UPI002E80A550|nr:type I restriction endonuclease [Dialister sp.]MEE3453361.1 type I restriction endonuclease [Dialister sp.]
MDTKEVHFEEAIENWLTSKGGWIKAGSVQYDRDKAIIPGDLISFIKTTQPKAWKKYAFAVGNFPEDTFIKFFVGVLARSDENILDVLRKGLKTQGVHFDFVYWKPETGINEENLARYEGNILRCVRQLHYSSENENSLDMTLFVNGIPLVVLELKNQLTGQSIENGKKQFREDRSPEDLLFKFRKRVLVYFTVDLYEAAMTTRLAGKSTYFMPFNQGSNGAGEVGGAGNPQTTEGFPTSYLWEKVLNKDTLLEIFQKYMVYDEDKDIMIFPRYHQLDVVTKLVEDVRKRGSGKNYLIQHSAGSGKSNSIAWLAYRLAGLHNDKDEKIFRSVIVVTDRRVLDQQLQNTIFQFDHVPGVVEKIDKNSIQLRDAINDGKKIIITTLQKFPVIFKEVHSEHYRFAIIVDEAHSSQTGMAARKLKQALTDKEAILEEYARIEGEEEAARKDDEDKLLDELATQGKQPNLSFFAFTATPKLKTLQLFGELQEDKSYRAFHIYSMQQAIEEGFILDVLKHYMTYKMYYGILKKSPENPELDNGKAIAAIKNFESLHPHNISQKVEVIMDHFLRVTRYKIGGHAKAMIVTASRLHAVRYLFAIREYIKKHNLEKVDVLVAFSGKIEDNGITYTEPSINIDKKGESISEKALPDVFKTDDFNILVVAEKYQTGFDEPLLHTMFVDKKLDGVKAVQTLSRLNRTCKGKDDTFVLDFVNSAEDIQKAFQPYYQATLLEEGTDPDVIYRMKDKLDSFGIYGPKDIEDVAKLFFANPEGYDSSHGDMAKLTNILIPSIGRYNAMDKEKRDKFRMLLARFDRVYSFVTQIARMFDKELHCFSIYAHFLLKVLPKKGKSSVNIQDLLNLEYYKLKQDFNGTITLNPETGTLKPIRGGDGGTTDHPKSPLDKIIENVNKRYGTHFTEMDKVFSQLTGDFLNDKKAVNFAKSNNLEMFIKGYYETKFGEFLFNRFKQNKEFGEMTMNHPEIIQQIMETLASEIYNALRNKNNENEGDE